MLFVNDQVDWTRPGPKVKKFDDRDLQTKYHPFGCFSTGSNTNLDLEEQEEYIQFLGRR